MFCSLGGAEKYKDHFERGIYVCAKCDHPLFSAKSKFNHDSAWPAFTETLQEDSVRKEVNYGCKISYVSAGPNEQKEYLPGQAHFHSFHSFKNIIYGEHVNCQYDFSRHFSSPGWTKKKSHPFLFRPFGWMFRTFSLQIQIYVFFSECFFILHVSTLKTQDDDAFKNVTQMS